MNMVAMQHHANDKIRLLMKLRREGIHDTRVLSAIESIPREAFVDKQFRDQAYEDTALPIASGQTISQPTVVAWMTYMLTITERMKVLEIGTGSGYQAAILSRLCRRVYTIERHKDLAKLAEKRFQDLRLHNITAKVGDGSKGWLEGAPFDRIIATAAASEVPKALLDQLADGGVMVIPVGEQGGEQILLRIEREGEQFHTQHLMSVRFVPLVAEN